MQKSSPALDQLLLDDYLCYCVFLVDKSGEIYLSTNLQPNDNAVQCMAGLYVQLKNGKVVETAIADTLDKLTKEESRVIIEALYNAKSRSGDSPVIEPIKNTLHKA